MVQLSELSARLTRSHNYNASTSAYKYQTNKIFADLESNNRSTAVVSPTHSTLPLTTLSARTEKLHQISENSRSKKLARGVDVTYSSTKDGSCFKRRKIDELQFAASQVKEDLLKSGLPFPSLDLSLHHHIDLDEALTRRGVQRVCAKSVASSPFLIPNCVNTVSADATMFDFENLFASTYDCYGTIKNSGTNSATVVSVISSTCSENMEVGSVIAPLLDDALLRADDVAASEEADKASVATVATAHQRRAIYANPITIREAFENSGEARYVLLCADLLCLLLIYETKQLTILLFFTCRLVTLSFAPFLVVHVNPAYTDMTGISPADILGKPFHEVIEDRTVKAATSKASSLTSLHEQVTSLQQGRKTDDDDTKECRIEVAVVGPENKDRTAAFDPNSVTHYMISLVEEDEPEATTVTDDDSSSEAEASASVTASEAAMFESSMDDDTTDAINARLLPILEPPSMRFHCGVMG
jgi:PAS domain-containing protein